jgi:hypothetical protein
MGFVSREGASFSDLKRSPPLRATGHPPTYFRDEAACSKLKKLSWESTWTKNEGSFTEAARIPGSLIS